MPKQSVHWHLVPLFAAIAVATSNVQAQTDPGRNATPATTHATPVSLPPPSEDKNVLRAVLELQTVFLVGSMYYITTTEKNQNWDINYEWEIFRRKVSGQAFGPDRNHFGTNFVGHPLGGAGYYLAARSNGLGVLESSAFSFMGSLLWELFGEIRENISLNDTIVTPAAGIAIGEATHQLGAFFDRGAPRWYNRTLGTFFGPFKSFNDWVDNKPLTRSETTFPTRGEWHEIRLSLGTAVAREWPDGLSPGAQFIETRVHLSERIVRLPPPFQPGASSAWFSDGNVSGISVDLAYGGGEVSHARLVTEAVLAGHHFRDMQLTKGGLLLGGAGVIGLGARFEYGQHSYARGISPADRISAVQPLGLVLQHQLALGDVRAETHVDVAPSFGGVRNLAQAAMAVRGQDIPLELLPPVAQFHGYYFGLGARASAGLRLTWQDWQAGGAITAQHYEGVDSPGDEVSARLVDTERVAQAHLTYRLGRHPVHVTLAAERRDRSGSLESNHTEQVETSLGLALGLTL